MKKRINILNPHTWISEEEHLRRFWLCYNQYISENHNLGLLNIDNFIFPEPRNYNEEDSIAESILGEYFAEDLSFDEWCEDLVRKYDISPFKDLNNF